MALSPSHRAGRGLAVVAGAGCAVGCDLELVGLRLDVRSAVTHLGGGNGDTAGWRPLTVDWETEGRRTRGWWRAEPGWAMAIAGDPAPAAPRDLGRR